MKTKKFTKEFAVRAKKLWKENQVFWKRRLKELNDLRKKRERLEFEKKKEEEKQEQLNQIRKIEFLIKRSYIYADIMAKKLGTDHQLRPEVAQSQTEVLNEADIELAKANVSNVLAENAERLKNYGGARETAPINFADAELGDDSKFVEVPKSFKGALKDYQFKGLKWLDNLYAQGINGILADEMGLGKTIQAIALLAHLSEHRDNWGPFLVIAPSTTLFNWRSECLKFCPLLRVLPFWGSKKGRHVLRRNLQMKHLGRPDSEFHIVITSYTIAVSDEKTLQRVNWQYIILDEAQAIKNMNSQRWARLLELSSRNKLLLTGTPIQNTMAELWALLHFIMPQLFDSHEQFQEWFSKDIEAHSQNRQKLNKTQLDRLHAILKPFMLRRVKKDVEKEIGRKFETEVYCDLSSRQRLLYESLKKRISLTDLFYIKENRDKAENLMNLVMQLKKVCNHPVLFERKIVRAPLFLSTALANDTHTLYSAKHKYHLLSVNNRSSLLTASCPRILAGSLLRPTKFLLEPQFTYFSDFAQIPRLLALMLLYPSDFSLLATICGVHYLKTREAIADSRSASTFFPVKVYQIQPNFSFEDQQPAVFHKLSEFYIPKVVAPPAKLISSSFQHPVLHQLHRRSPCDPFRIEYPQFVSMIYDSTKLLYLDRLLVRLKSENQRVLIFCQMTKMLDILEEYLQFKKYHYLRLDGGCPISDRRDKVNAFQDNQEIFIFLLSTRAGGLGVTLTAADVVVFYDNDWNPTMDAQAADRAHRIGRTKDVNVYRLITRNTIEERIVKRAQQKNNVQQTVYSGEVFKGNVFRTHDVMSLLFDESEIKDKERKEVLAKQEKGKRKRRDDEKNQDRPEEALLEDELDANLL